MEFIVIAVTLIIVIILIKIIYKINIKELKKIGEDNKELDEKVSKYPSNVEICKAILKKLNNESVNIEEDKNADSSLYIAISNKIVIANMRESFSRIQTIAHECLHSVQDRSILLFNFIYSWIYIMYFYIVAALGIFKILPNKILFLTLYIIFSFVYYFVRSYLEDDAMIKARFLAKEYMEETKISSKEEIKQIVDEYDKLNNIGIKAVNYNVLFKIVVKTVILSLIFFFR